MQEALRNVALHAGAHEVTVVLRASGDALQLIITDDGRGFRPDGARGVGGLGLISLDERIRLAGGSLKISSELQRGTKLCAKVPLARDESNLAKPNLAACLPTLGASSTLYALRDCLP